MKTLTQLQEETANAILALSENGKQAMGYGIDFLNKRGRGLAAIRRRYVKAAMALGFDKAQALRQWGDVKDHAMLLHVAEGEA